VVVYQFLTGAIGTGESTVISKLCDLGYKVVDTRYGGFMVDVDSCAGAGNVCGAKSGSSRVSGR
jgi:hypothetical protein